MTTNPLEPGGAQTKNSGCDLPKKQKNSWDSLHFASRLKKWRKSQGITTGEAARKFGVVPSTWCHWESGRRFPSGDNLAMISEFTGLPLPYFFCPDVETCPQYSAIKPL